MFKIQYEHGIYPTHKIGIFWYNTDKVIAFYLLFGILYIKLW
jgi:hypothetical protein